MRLNRDLMLKYLSTEEFRKIYSVVPFGTRLTLKGFVGVFKRGLRNSEEAEVEVPDNLYDIICFFLDDPEAAADEINIPEDKKPEAMMGVEALKKINPEAKTMIKSIVKGMLEKCSLPGTPEPGTQNQNAD